MFAYLDLGFAMLYTICRLVLVGPWGHLLCVVAFVPLRACFDVTTCEIHLRGVDMLDTHLSLLHVMLMCLPCLLCATRLAFFAFMHLCTLAYMFIHEFVCRPYSNQKKKEHFPFIIIRHEICFPPTYNPLMKYSVYYSGKFLHLSLFSFL